MSLIQILCAIGGLVALVIGILMIAMRHNAVEGRRGGQERPSRGNFRAVVAGCVALLIALLLFASAGGILRLV